MSNQDQQQEDRNQQTPQKMPTRPGKSLMGWVILIGLGVLLMTFIGHGFGDDRREISATEFWKYVENKDQVTGEIIVKEHRIEGENSASVPLRKDEARKFYVVYSHVADKDFDRRLSAALKNNTEPVKHKYQLTPWWKSLLPNLIVMIVIFLAIWFFVFRRLGSAGGGGGLLGSFGRSRHRVMTKEHTRVTFDDVAGIDEAKDELKELIEFLKSPKKFQRLGGRIPRGVLLVGEPGCGKTLLAKAIAGEADVPFFLISGSDFVEMFVGVGASRVRDLFKQAKDSSPCIIFLDEIDAVGRRRGVGFNGGGHDEREQTLNAILVEMDGFGSSDQVIVISATNRADVLDPALTRPGRFDRQVQVPLPDVKGRYEILKIYADKVACGPDVDLNRLARGTPMFSGADLEALVNEGAIEATMANKDMIEQADLEEARDRVRWGRARKSRAIDESEKQITAYHEAGHALVQALTPMADPLHKVSIIPRGAMGGATFALPEKDRYIYTRQYCKAQLRVLLGGRLSEEMFCDDMSSGAASDIAQATLLARRMILDWGMSDELGFVRYSGEDQRMMPPGFGEKEYSEKTAELIDREVRGIINEAKEATIALLESNRQIVENIAKALTQYETLSGEEVQDIIDGKVLDKPTVGDLLDREHQKAVPDDPAPAAPPVPEPGPDALPEPG